MEYLQWHHMYGTPKLSLSLDNYKDHTPVKQLSMFNELNIRFIYKILTVNSTNIARLVHILFSPDVLSKDLSFIKGKFCCRL